jgi:plasmid stabilization system protein ParE
MYKAIILPLAKDDIKSAAHWYNDKQQGLGKRFTKEVRDKVLFIRKNPKVVAIRYDDTRCAVLRIFPFMIHFNVDEDNKLVIIVAVFHTALDPERWTKR